MTLAFVFLPFVFMNLLRQIFVFIKNLSYDNCCDKPMSNHNHYFQHFFLRRVNLFFSISILMSKRQPLTVMPPTSNDGPYYTIWGLIDPKVSRS